MQTLDEGTFLAFESAMESASSLMMEEELGEAGPLYEEFVENMRAHAILYLLVDAKPEKFFQDLIVSAFAWRHYLRRCAENHYRDYCSALSRFDAFFDALAGDHISLAVELVELGPRDWMQGDEYEEDFCWVRFLGVFAAQGNAAGPELDQLLARAETSLQGLSSGRLEVCRALRAGDSDAFATAFAELALGWEKESEAVALRAEEEAVIAAGTQVFVEGLAVLRLAQRIGISVEQPFRGCPPLAQRPRRNPPIADPFTD